MSVHLLSNAKLDTFEALLLAREQLDAAQKHEARLRQAIQIHMGEAGKATFACGGSVTWRRSKDGQVFNTAQFAKEHPEMAKAYLTTRPGSRRFCVHEA